MFSVIPDHDISTIVIKLSWLGRRSAEQPCVPRRACRCSGTIARIWSVRSWVQIPPPRLFRNIKSHRRLRKRLLAGFELFWTSPMIPVTNPVPETNHMVYWLTETDTGPAGKDLIARESSMGSRDLADACLPQSITNGFCRCWIRTSA